jgi:hypothetical protein
MNDVINATAIEKIDGDKLPLSRVEKHTADELKARMRIPLAITGNLSLWYVHHFSPIPIATVYDKIYDFVHS